MMIWCNLYGWYRQLWVSVLKPRADTGADMRSVSQPFYYIVMNILVTSSFFEIYKFYENFEIFWKILKSWNFWKLKF
jgi:hypothetical protein